MRIAWVLLATLLASSCTGMLVGGGSGDYSGGQRDAAVASSDAQMDARIAARLNDDPVLGRSGVLATTHNGTVTLSGTVTNYSARNRAGQIAGDTPGVVMVNNQIVVQN